MMSIIGQTYFDTRGSVAQPNEVKQTHIFYAMQRIENQVEQCGEKFDVLLHRLRVVSRDPKLAQEDNQSMPKREGNSELAQRLNGIMNGLEELDRRIAMQLDMLEL
jgi:tetrahydromethanopterin S-methyltransferase subunit B